MVKVSITLPNSAQITLESEEPEIISDVVSIVLRDLPKDLMQQVSPHGPDAVQGRESQKGISVDDHEITAEPRASSDTPSHLPSLQDEPVTIPAAMATRRTKSVKRVPQDDTPNMLSAASAESTDAFVKFCGSASPLGDMRRVVVATEGAQRILGMESVNAEDLGKLFDLVGWRRPHNFTQTLRNAARDKFRWLERVPGRAGRYAATDLGRSVTMGD